MRRSAKLSPKKQKNRASLSQASPTESELEVNSAIPGRINSDLWSDMLTREETDELVGEIVSDLLSKVLDRCFEIYIKKQMVPYTVSWAKSHITETLENQILCLDYEEEPEECWCSEDLEPLPARPDSWAQGCVPSVSSLNPTAPLPTKLKPKRADVFSCPGHCPPTSGHQAEPVQQK